MAKENGRTCSGAWRKKLITTLATFFLLVAVVFYWVNEKYIIPATVLRLHVVAHSDLPADQVLKLRVRDLIVRELQPYMQAAKSRDEAVEIVALRQKDLEARINEELRALGVAYRAQVQIKKQEFPPCTYLAFNGDKFTFPGGNYTALQVVLGEGEGHNWWCVLFPPLCLAVDSGTIGLESPEVAGSAAHLTHSLPAWNETCGRGENALSFSTGRLLSGRTPDGGQVELRLKIFELWWRQVRHHQAQKQKPDLTPD